MIRSLLIASAACVCLAAPLPAAESTYETIDDLGFTQQDAAGPKLVGYLDSDDPQERWRAARALGNLAYQPAAEQLAGLLSDDDDEPAPAAAQKADKKRKHIRSVGSNGSSAHYACSEFILS